MSTTLAVLILLSTVQIDAQWEGRYIETAVYESMLDRNRRVAEHRPADLTVGATGLHVSNMTDGWQAVPVRVERADNGEIYTVKELQEEQDVLFQKLGNRRLLTWEGRDYLRVEDVVPALAHLDTNQLRTVALLSRGYTAGTRNDTTVAFLDGRAFGWWHDAVSGGFDFNDLISIGDADYLFEQTDNGIVLRTPLEQDGPDIMPDPQGETLRLRRTRRPPFVVLADHLQLRHTAGTDGKVVGRLKHGDRVAAWTRAKEEVQVGSIRGHWVLVQKGKTIGWTFFPYLAFVKSEGTKEAGVQLLAPPAFNNRIDQGSRPGSVWMLANLNDDAALDRIRIDEAEGTQSICVFRSLGDGAFAEASCVSRAGDGAVQISGKDMDGDGNLDLIIGAKNVEPVTAYFEPKHAAYSMTKPVPVVDKSGPRPSSCACRVQSGAPSGGFSLVGLTLWVAWVRRRRTSRRAR